MKPMRFTATIDAPAARVFEACTNFAEAPRRVSGIKGVEMLTPGPVRVGTRFKETRILFGKEATEEMWVSSLEPGRSYTLSCNSCGMEYATTFRFEPQDDSTRVELEMRGRPLTIAARVMGAVMAPLMKGMMRKCVEQDLQDIKEFCERRA